MSWLDGPLVGFDTETTGVDTASDRIVTAAVVVRVPGVSTDVHTWLINPGVDIPAGATAVHGITTEHARENGDAPETALEEIASLLHRHLRAGAPIVAFNASFDVRILEAELARHGLPTLADRLGRDVSPVLDPLVLDRWVDRWRKGPRRLGNVVAHYGVALDNGELHTAEVDVLATLDVLEAIAAEYPAVGSASLDELHAAQVQAHRDWAVGFNNWLASKGKVADVDPTWL